MKILFTKSSLCASKFITWVSNKDCSHFVILFDENSIGGGLVFHCSLLKGSTVEWFGDLMSHSRIVHCLKFKNDLTVQEEEKFYQKIISEYFKEPYDMGAFCFWIWRGILNRWFGTPITQSNYWSVKGKNLCTSMVKAVYEYLNIPMDFDPDMILPHDLWLKLKSTGLFDGDEDYAYDTNEKYDKI
jgi:hypothetical protein